MSTIHLEDMELDAETLEDLAKRFPYPVLVLRPLVYQKNFKLPSDYTYKLLSDSNNLFEFRIKEVKDKESAMDWLRKYQEENKTTWRIQRTFKNCNGKKNLFKADYRCQHNTDKRFRSEDSKRSKNTNCEAKLNIKINRYFDIDKWKPLKEEVKEFPCYVGLFGEHNHTFDKASKPRSRVSKKRSQNKEQTDEHGEMATPDTHPFDSAAKSVPRMSKKRSPNKEQTNEHGEMATSDNMVTDEDNDQEFSVHEDSNQECSVYEDNNQECSVYEDNNQEFLNNEDNNQEFSNNEDNNQEFSDDDDLKEFDLLVNRIKKCRQENPTAFKPALLAMAYNANNFARTESSLLSALSNFANCTGPTSSSLEPTPQKSRVLKNVQPTAVSRRKPVLAPVKNRKSKMRRKSQIEEHDYAVLKIPFNGTEVTIRAGATNH